MKPGRKPTPTNVLKLRGSWRAKKRLDYNNNEDEISECPACPNWLSAAAKKEWRRVVPKIFDMGILKPVDSIILSMYCCDLAEFISASKDIAGLESQFLTQPSGRICRHPLLTVRDAAGERIRKLSGELGLTPAARTGLAILPKVKKEDDKSRFFTKKNTHKSEPEIA